MRIKIFFLLFIFSSNLLFSQSTSLNSSSEMKPHSNLSVDELIPDGEFLTGLNKHLSKMEKSIADKIIQLEKLHLRITELNKNLKDKVSIAEEIPTLGYNGNIQQVTSRQVEFTFQSDKTKEIKIISRKMNMSNDLYSVIRTVTFFPEKIESLKMKIDQFDTKTNRSSEVEEYSNMPLEVKIEALKSVDNILLNAILRFEGIIQKNGMHKVDKGKKNFKEL